MFRPIYFAPFIVQALTTPALAQDAGAGLLPTILFPAQAAFLIFAMAIAGYLAYAAFDTPPIPLGDGPTLPRYMTQPNQYRLAVIAYVAISLVFYDLGAYFFRELTPVIALFAPDWMMQAFNSASANGTLSFPLTVVFAAMIFFVLLKIESDWNPLFLLRRMIWSWVSIPQLASAILALARDSLVVPAAARAEVVGNPDTPHVDLGDFDKERTSLDRHWAELCYIRMWLAKNRARGSHYTFFNEASFSWEKLEADYDRARRSISPLKQILSRGDALDLAEVAGKVEGLRTQYCRLAACFLVFKNETKQRVVADAQEFGVPIADRISRSNPMRYLWTFLAAVIFAIYAAVSLSAGTWDVLVGDPSSALNQDPELVTRWTGYGMANYGAPILVALCLSYVGWTRNHNQPASYPIAYARLFIIAMCVSAVALTCAVKYVSASSHSGLPFLTILLSEFRWSLSPALVSVYIAAHVDRQIDPLLPDILTTGTYRELFKRVIMCVVFGLLVTLLSLQPSLVLTPAAGSAWPAAKLRFVVIATVFTIGLTMALVGEFLLVKPRPKTASEGSGSGVSGAGGRSGPRSLDVVPSH